MAFFFLSFFFCKPRRQHKARALVLGNSVNSSSNSNSPLKALMKSIPTRPLREEVRERKGDGRTETTKKSLSSPWYREKRREREFHPPTTCVVQTQSAVASSIQLMFYVIVVRTVQSRGKRAQFSGPQKILIHLVHVSLGNLFQLTSSRLSLSSLSLSPLSSNALIIIIQE